MKLAAQYICNIKATTLRPSLFLSFSVIFHFFPGPIEIFAFGRAGEPAMLTVPIEFLGATISFAFSSSFYFFY